MNPDEPLEFEVCTGGTCGPLGGKETLAWLRKRVPEAQSRVVNCFARCQETTPLCPCVKLSGTWLVQADRDVVKRALRERGVDV